MTYEASLKFIMGLPEGREVVWELLSRGQIFSSNFNADPYLNAYNSGRREAHIPLYAECESLVPHLMELARKEAHARSSTDAHARADANARAGASAEPDPGTDADSGADPDPYARTD